MARHRIHTSVRCVRQGTKKTVPLRAGEMNREMCCECSSPGFSVGGLPVDRRRTRVLSSAVGVLSHFGKLPGRR